MSQIFRGSGFCGIIWNMESAIFVDISLILGVAIVLAFLVQLLRQPLIISYIITGIICGPVFLNLINSNQHFFDIFAEFGVILLLFLVGLSLNIDYLKRIGKVAVITGAGQVIFTSSLGFLILLVLGFSQTAAIFLAISVTFSSTIIIMKLLADKGEARTVYGRYTIGLMLVQDIIAIAVVVLLPSMNGSQHLVLSLFLLFAKLALLFLAVYVLSRVILPVLLDRVAQNTEFLLIFILAWCFALAGFGEWVGLSLEVGAIMAGLSLGSSVYQAEISSRLKPLRDFFIALFFIILGSEMNIIDLQSSLIPGLVMAFFVLFGNPFILYLLYRAMKFTRKNSFYAGVTAAQVSEFGFVFLFIATQMGYVGSEVLSVFTVVALVTIFVSSYLITYNHQVFRAIKPALDFFGEDKRSCPREPDDIYDVIVFGYHRLGWKICEALKEMKVSFAVVDNDPRTLKKLQDREVPHFFGDASEVDFLCELPFAQAKMIISTLPDAEDQKSLIRYVRSVNQEALVIANLSHIQFLSKLYEAGADYILVPHLVSGQWMADILKRRKWSRHTFRQLSRLQRHEMKLRFNLGHH